MSLFKGITVISYPVMNWEAAKKFYGELLEWPVAWSSDEMGCVEYGSENQTHLSISLWRDATPPDRRGPIAVLEVEDAHKTIAALRAKGVRCDDVVDIPGVVSYGTLYDPEGNQIQFAGSPPPAA